jgi:hypothetical protein
MSNYAYGMLMGLGVVGFALTCAFFCFKLSFDRTNAHGVEEHRSAMSAFGTLLLQRLLMWLGSAALLVGALILIGVLSSR